jgi:hypothetical protein
MQIIVDDVTDLVTFKDLTWAEVFVVQRALINQIAEEENSALTNASRQLEDVIDYAEDVNIGKIESYPATDSTEDTEK